MDQQWKMCQGYSFEGDNGEELLHIDCDGVITLSPEATPMFLAECLRAVLQNREDTIDILHNHLNELKN